MLVLVVRIYELVLINNVSFAGFSLIIILNYRYLINAGYGIMEHKKMLQSIIENKKHIYILFVKGQNVFNIEINKCN